MNAQRIVFIIVLTLQGACVTAAQQNVIPAWTPYLTLLGSVLLALMHSIAVPPKDDSSPPKLPAILLVLGALAVAGSVSACAAFAQDVAKYGPTPSQQACVIAEVENGDIVRPLDVAIKCGIPETILADVIKLIEGAKIAKAARLARARASETCDGGSDAGK